MEIFNNKMEIVFTSNRSANKAKEIASKVVASFEHKTLFLNAAKNTINRLFVEGNTMKHPENDGGDLTSEELLEIAPVILRAIAEQLPSECFTFNVVGYDTYTEGWLEGKYDNGKLEMKSTFYPMGYEENLYCPECGEFVVTLDEYDPSETYRCPECGEKIDLAAEFEDVTPIIQNITLVIA